VSRESPYLRRADESLRVALVTGACSGIGQALAHKLGALGYELVLVSQRPAELAAVGAELAAAYGARVHAIVLDLARPDAAEELDLATQARGLAVDILVNNAGFFFFGEAADAPLPRARAMLELHVVTPSLLCSRFARQMRARRRGHILIVSSLSACRDFPGISYYGASKKYLRGFAASLRSELAVYGVNVTCLLPGATATALYDPTVVPVQWAKRLGVMMDADAVAEAGLGALFARKAECMPGLLTRCMAVGAAVMPQRVIDLARRHAPWLPPIAAGPPEPPAEGPR
jgi:short-subunit dehydrogenase